MSVHIVGAHPLADRFPMLPEDELQRLSEDIAENGLRQPVVVDADGLVLDGRNRLAACKLAGVEPVAVTYAPMGDDDVAAFILSANVARRHQSTGSRAMSTALVLADSGKRKANGRWEYGSVGRADSQNLGNVWTEAMRQAGQILDHAPDLAPAVVDGTLALDAAYRQAELRRAETIDRLARDERLAAEESDARAFIEENAPDLAARVDGTDLLTFVEARDLWNRRNREEAERLRREEAKRAAEEKAAREQSEQEVQSSARALLTLAGARYPEWRQRLRVAHTKYPACVEPTARAMWSPENIRLVAAWLNTLADEMEH